MEKDFFAGVEVERMELPSGRVMELPVRYYDWSAMMAHFPAPVAKLRELLPSQRLKPALLTPGTGLLTLAAFEYRDLACFPPYNELAIGIPVQYEPAVNIPALPLLRQQWFSTFGLYIHHLPVTTQEAYEFGVEVWGYPKFLAEISFEETEQVRRCFLHADGKDILTLEVEKLRTKKESLDYYSYTVKGGQLLRTHIEVQGEAGMVRLRGGATFALGDHPIADQLGALNIGEKAAECLYAPRVQSMLHAAERRLLL